MDTALLWAGIVMEAAFISLLMYRRVFRVLPLFCLYVIWSFCSDIAMLIAMQTVRSRFPTQYLQMFLIEMTVDSLLQFGVLVELTWSILRPVRSSLPRGAIVAVAVLVAIAGAVVWPVAGISELTKLTPQWHLLMRLQQTFSILRVVFFLVIAGSSQVLALGWRNRELQVATGLGFYSLVSLGATMLHAHQTASSGYHHVDQFVAASYFCSLVYWVVSFAQKEAVRQEFSPKMQSFMLALAGTARLTRVALSDAPTGIAHKPRKR